MVAISENFGDLLEPGLRKIFVDAFMQKERLRPILFNVESSDTSYEKQSSVGGFGDFSVFKGTIQYDDVYQGEDVQFNPVEFASGFKVERRLFDDDLYGVIAKRPMGLGIAASRTMEKHAIDVFNNGFNAADAGNIVVDGVTVQDHSHADQLFSTTHSLGTARTSTTQSNSLTLAFSATNVETARRTMAGFLDDTGNLISVSGDLLLVPRELEQSAFEVIASAGQVNSAQNNVNFHQGRYKLAVSDLLTDAENWFMIDSQMMRMSLHWFDRIPLEFFKDKDFDTLIAKYGAYWRASWGWADWRWAVGSAP